MTSINAYREWNGEYQLVGTLRFKDGRTLFEYAPEYRRDPSAAPISHSLPLASGSNSVDAAAPSPEAVATFFFDGLLPEEEMRTEFEHALHGSNDGGGSLLARLNNESIGALVFGDEPATLWAHRSYSPLDEEFFESFARNPKRTAVQMGTASRLSLAGAQSKVGLHSVKNGDGRIRWFKPEGSAPSSVIVKAQSINSVAGHLSVNEALCIRTAEELGFDTAQVSLFPVEGAEPLLIVQRFDRTRESDAPKRLHQEDFCQALGFPSEFRFKYEPTDGNYLSLCASLIARVSSNPFEDRMVFFQEVLLDYLMGNCDNHLKNFSFTWSSDWKKLTLSPLYDVTCTTIYDFDREMGISLCPSRRIDDVTAEDIKRAAKAAGIPEKIGWGMYEDLRDGFIEALSTAAQQLTGECCGKEELQREIEQMAEKIATDAKPRLGMAPRLPAN